MLEKHYSPADIEGRIYAQWDEAGAFRAGRNTKSHVWLRWFNEFPVVVLFAAVFLVVFKPT